MWTPLLVWRCLAFADRLRPQQPKYLQLLSRASNIILELINTVNSGMTPTTSPQNKAARNLSTLHFWIMRSFTGSMREKMRKKRWKAKKSCKLNNLFQPPFSNFIGKNYVEVIKPKVIVRMTKWCLFFLLNGKVKIFYFFYSVKSNLLTSSNVIKVNLLSINSV